MNLNIIANSLKHSTIGIVSGTGLGAVTESVADELCALLGLVRSQHATELMAELLVRAATSGIMLLVGQRLMRGINANLDDPSDNALFAYGFSAAQPHFYSAAVAFPNAIKKAISGELGGSCCKNCEDGAECAGAK